MGGTGSGRYGGRPTVEGGLTISVGSILGDHRRLGDKPVRGWRGTLEWTNGHAGEPFASIDYTVILWPDHGELRLRYTRTLYSGVRRDEDYTVDLVATPQPFGGVRWWMVCPISGDRVAKLHLPNGQTVFGSRRAHRLGYRSQRQSPHDQAVSMVWKLRGRLKGEGGMSDYIPKPKGMWWRVYDREVERLAKKEHAAMHLGNASMLRLIEKIGPMNGNERISKRVDELKARVAEGHR